MSGKTRYYINMNDGRVIAGTEETKDNIFYKEIDISWALAIRDGKITAKEVINKVNAKVGMIPFSEMMEAVQKMNVRTKDLHMEEHAQGADASADTGDGASGVIGEFKESPKGGSRKTKAGEKAAAALGLPAEGEKADGESQNAEGAKPSEGESEKSDKIGGLNI